MMSTCWRVAALAALCLSCVLLFQGVIPDLVRDWSRDQNYSHGFLIVPLAAYLVWERRHRLRRAAAPSLAGLVVVAASLVLLAAGLLGAELFVGRLALIGTIAGSVLYLLGPAHLRILAFPIGILFLAVPIPAIIFNQITFPLQLLASRAGVAALSAAAIPVLREGNVIVLPHATLQVAEACSGIRSLVSLLTLAIVYGYFMQRGIWSRLTLAMAAVPVAILMNALRVAGTGLIAYYLGADAADGFFHGFSGWLIFVGAVIVLASGQQLFRRLGALYTAQMLPQGAR